MPMVEAGHLRDAQGFGDLDALKQEIIAEVESKLAESLWRRGQCEIRKLQQEEEMLVSAVDRLQEQQEVMRKESREMQAALAQVTANFELVVHQMREAFRLMPQPPGAHAAKDTDCGRWTPQQSPTMSDCPPGLESLEATPPAAVLSLANALLPVNTLPVAPPCTRLQLAEILSQQEDADRPSIHSSQPSTPRQSGKVETLRVMLIKDPGFTTLGMDVRRIQPGLLCVDGIDAHGLVGVHNVRQSTTQTRILEGDRIREINGVKEDTELMLAECKSKQQLMIVLERRVNSSRHEKATTLGRDESTSVARQPASQLRPDAEAFVPCSPLELEDRMLGMSAGHSMALLSSPPDMNTFHHDFRSLPLHNLSNLQHAH